MRLDSPPHTETTQARNASASSSRSRLEILPRAAFDNGYAWIGRGASTWLCSPIRSRYFIVCFPSCSSGIGGDLVSKAAFLRAWKHRSRLDGRWSEDVGNSRIPFPIIKSPRLQNIRDRQLSRRCQTRHPNVYVTMKLKHDCQREPRPGITIYRKLNYTLYNKPRSVSWKFQDVVFHLASHNTKESESYATWLSR